MRPLHFSSSCLLAAALGAVTAHGAWDDRPTGFAAVAAHGVEMTVGGGNMEPIEVHNAAEFQAAVERRDIQDKKARDNTPRVVAVVGTIDLGELANMRPGGEMTEVGIVYPRNHTTIVGRTSEATIRRGTIEVHGAHNVVIRGLRFRDLWELDPTGEYDDLGWDFISITNSGQTLAHHIWIDHCDFEQAYDGMVDITHGSDLVTISWCRFAGDARGPQKKVCLIGASSSPGAASRDTGRLNVTLHHNWFFNIQERTPRARFGNIHAFSNLIEGAEYGTISVMGAVTLVEGNVYRNAKVATTYSHAADTVDRGKGGTICIVDSLNLDPRATSSDSDAADFEAKHNFESNVERRLLRFNSPKDWAWEAADRLPYSYSVDPVASVSDTIKAGAGTAGNNGR